MKKIQLTLTDHEAELIALKASEFGYSLPKMIKFLVTSEADKIWQKIVEMKTVRAEYKSSEKTPMNLSAMVSEGRTEYKTGKAKSFASFLDQLDDDK